MADLEQFIIFFNVSLRQFWNASSYYLIFFLTTKGEEKGLGKVLGTLFIIILPFISPLHSSEYGGFFSWFCLNLDASLGWKLLQIYFRAYGCSYPPEFRCQGKDHCVGSDRTLKNCHSLMPQVQPLSRLELCSLQLHTGRAHTNTTHACTYTACSTDQTDTLHSHEHRQHQQADAVPFSGWAGWRSTTETLQCTSLQHLSYSYVLNHTHAFLVP